MSLVFGNAAFGEIKDYSLRTTKFQNKSWKASFEFVSTLRKKVFSRAQVKCFSLYGASNSDSVVFRNTTFEEINDHSLRTTPSQKHICCGNFRYVSTLREKVYSRAPVRCFAFFLIAQITQILLFSGIAPLERSKIIVREWHILKKEIFYEIFRQMRTLRKKVFSRAPVKCFSLYGSNYSDSVVFGNASFGEIKNHSLI